VLFPRRELWAHAAIALTWIVLVGFSFAPGTLSTDSLEQYAQGLTHQYNNLHPPAYSLLLSLSAALSSSPVLVFIVQLCLLAVGGWLVTSRLSGARAPIAYAALLLLPPIWAVGIAIWKDVFFAAVTLIAAALIVDRRRRGLTWVCLGLAVLMRHNAIVAAAPLVAMLVHDTVKTTRRRAAIGGIAAICLLSVGPLVELATRADRLWPAGQLYIFAMGGVTKRANLELPNYPGLASRHVDDAVTPLIGVPPDQAWSVAFLASHREEVSRDASELVSEHPLFFAQHRLAVFAALIGAGRETVCSPFHPGVDANGWGFGFSPRTTALRDAMFRVRDATQNGFLFRGWFWLSLELGLLVWLLRRRSFRYALVAASGLIYAGSFLLFAPSCDFRYLYWTVLSTCLAAAGLVSEGARRRDVAPSSG
jgi:hypothetical protein